MYWGREEHTRIWWGSLREDRVWIRNLGRWEDGIKMALQETG